MDVPSTCRIRPTALNRRLCQRFVADDLKENDEADNAVDAEEVVEEHLEAQEQPKVHEQAGLRQQTSIVVEARTGELLGGL